MKQVLYKSRFTHPPDTQQGGMYAVHRIIGEAPGFNLPVAEILRPVIDCNGEGVQDSHLANVQNLLHKMYYTKCITQNVLYKMYYTKCVISIGARLALRTIHA